MSDEALRSGAWSLKSWLRDRRIGIIRPGIGIGYYTDDLEADPAGVIELVEAMLAECAMDGPVLL